MVILKKVGLNIGKITPISTKDVHFSPFIFICISLCSLEELQKATFVCFLSFRSFLKYGRCVQHMFLWGQYAVCSEMWHGPGPLKFKIIRWLVCWLRPLELEGHGFYDSKGHSECSAGIQTSSNS